MAGKREYTQDAGFSLEKYLTRGVENIMKGTVRTTLKDPKESAFMARFAIASKSASKKRAEAEVKGEHIPPFLIASITSSCNLHCAGCYARHNHACTDEKAAAQLTGDEWKNEMKKVLVAASLPGEGFFISIPMEEQSLVRSRLIQTST